MVRMGTVWDRTTEVMQGRAAILASLATLYVFLPNVVASGFSAFAEPGGGTALVGRVVGFAATVLLIAGVLAITAVASDPAVGRDRASAIGFRRLPVALGLIAIMVAVLVVVLAPIGVMLVNAGVTIDPATGQADMTAVDRGVLGTAGLLTIVAAIVGLWISAKLSPLFAVVVNERRGIGVFGRSFALTRGSSLRLIGVIILYAIVLIVTILAATSVVGIVARLILGAEATGAVSFIVALVSAALTAVATVVQTVFYAQYYVAARGAAEGLEPAR